MRLRQTHQGLVRAQLQRHGGELAHSDLEDLEQEVWIAVWLSLPRFHGDSSFTTWLVGVTKNILHGWLRRKRSKQLGLEHFHELDGGRESEGAREHDPLNRLSISEALNCISAPQHQVIELRYFQQLTDREIARRLHVPLGTVKGRIRSGLVRLRRNLA